MRPVPSSLSNSAQSSPGPLRPFWLKLDPILIGLVMILALTGIFTIWGAASTDGEIGPLRGFAKRQTLWLCIASGILVVTALLNFEWLRPMVWLFFGLYLLLLLAVLFLGVKVNGATSWFPISTPAGQMRFQPSEPGKIVMVLVLARYLSDLGRPPRRFVEIMIPISLVGVPITLIVLQPDLGTACVYIPLTLVMLYVAGIRKRIFVGFFALGLIVLIAGYPILRPYQKDRVKMFLDPTTDPLGSGYNVIQAQTALGSGGLTGKGWGQGTQTSMRFLPEYQTDFIFPTLGEQFGFVGCGIVLTLFGALMLRGTIIASRAQDQFAKLIVAGLTTILATHIFLNVGMALGLLPVTGLPLPFLSYGGSFMLTCAAATGLMASVSARS